MRRDLVRRTISVVIAVIMVGFNALIPAVVAGGDCARDRSQRYPVLGDPL